MEFDLWGALLILEEEMFRTVFDQTRWLVPELKHRGGAQIAPERPQRIELPSSFAASRIDRFILSVSIRDYYQVQGIVTLGDKAQQSTPTANNHGGRTMLFVVSIVVNQNERHSESPRILRGFDILERNSIPLVIDVLTGSKSLLPLSVVPPLDLLMSADVRKNRRQEVIIAADVGSFLKFSLLYASECQPKNRKLERWNANLHVLAWYLCETKGEGATESSHLLSFVRRRRLSS
jgi:hypothetical protein